MSDPTRDEMLEFLKFAAHQYDEFDIEAAIYWFASDYHGGQSSNLYKALCKSPFRPSPLHASIVNEGFEAEDLYYMLEDQYCP
jgi:hypothetical protein